MKSTAEKKASGTLQKCRVKNTPSYDPLEQVPEPAFKLNPDGLEYFQMFCNILLSNKTLTAAYIPIITRAARFYEIYKEADKEVRSVGAVQVSQTGWSQKSGHFTLMMDADDRMTKIEAMFGLNLAAMLKLDIPKPEKKNPFLEI